MRADAKLLVTKSFDARVEDGERSKKVKAYDFGDLVQQTRFDEVSNYSLPRMKEGVTLEIKKTDIAGQKTACRQRSFGRKISAVHRDS